MSTKALPPLLYAMLAIGLCNGCAQSSSSGVDASGHFDDLHLGRGRADAAAQAEPELRPRLPAPPAVLPVTVDAAAARVAAYLGQAGFTLEEQRAGAGRLFTATRMGAPDALGADAVCGLEALHRPDISSTELTVRLSPAPGGVAVESRARFVEVDTRILAGTLTRQTCRSRGVLEGAIRRAALGS